MPQPPLITYPVICTRLIGFLDFIRPHHHCNDIRGVSVIPLFSKASDRILGVLQSSFSDVEPGGFRCERSQDEEGDWPNPLDCKWYLLWSTAEYS